MSDSNDNEQIAEAIAIVKTAFEPDASTIQVAQGQHVLTSLLSALRTKQTNPAGVAGSVSTEPTPTATAATAAAATAAQKPMSFILETVINFLKEHLDDEDLAVIAAQPPPFSVPFIPNH